MRVRYWTWVALCAVVGLGCGEPRSVGPLPSPCAATFTWLDKAKPTPDRAGMVELPMMLDHVAVDHRVWIGAGPEGRCLLAKTKLGPKDNFEGRVCCEGALPKAKGGGGTPAFLSIGDGLLEELYVKDLHPPSWAEVYFDLN
ncbi:MAG: hypothetical protein EP329_02760 [Deltaproteobacteria bacterium]|nr:MAG: hypothetical protein EP329_02760 [Deltaproteobacteria bacterium]